MKPISQPAAQAQPDQISYGVDSLALFETYTRDSYRAAFGMEAPPWDPSRPAKAWFDSTANAVSAGHTVTYQAVARDANGNWALQPMTLPAADAAAVNFPQSIVYPPYVILPTSATRGGAPVNPVYLSLESEARALMAALGGTEIVDQGVNVFAPVLYPPDELRRMWVILGSGGQQNNAGGLLQMRNAAGVGAPGQWQNSAGDPVWVPDPPAPTGMDDPRPPVDMPVRDLLPNEELRPGLMGFGVLVYRTDLELEQAMRNGAFTADDRKMLEAIYQAVSKPAA